MELKTKEIKGITYGLLMLKLQAFVCHRIQACSSRKTSPSSSRSVHLRRCNLSTLLLPHAVKEEGEDEMMVTSTRRAGDGEMQDRSKGRKKKMEERTHKGRRSNGTLGKKEIRWVNYNLVLQVLAPFLF